MITTFNMRTCDSILDLLHATSWSGVLWRHVHGFGPRLGKGKIVAEAVCHCEPLPSRTIGTVS